MRSIRELERDPLNRTAAERLLGWTYTPDVQRLVKLSGEPAGEYETPLWTTPDRMHVPGFYPLSRIADAMKLVEAMHARGDCASMVYMMGAHRMYTWHFAKGPRKPVSRHQS